MILLHIIGGLTGLTSGAVALSATHPASVVHAGAAGVFAHVLLAGTRVVHTMAPTRIAPCQGMQAGRRQYHEF